MAPEFDRPAREAAASQPPVLPSAAPQTEEPREKRRLFPWLKIHVTTKFFLVLVILLLLNLVCITVFGNTFIARFYLHNRQEFLGRWGGAVLSALEDPAALSDIIFEVEQNNVTVLLFQKSDHEGTDIYSTIYYSRPEQTLTASRYNLAQSVTNGVNRGVLQELTPGGTPAMHINYDDDGGRLMFYAQADSGVYLILETPLEYVMESSRLAITFVFTLSLGLLFIGSIAAFFIARWISRPIREIDLVTQKLCRMDFSQRCRVSSRDEIETLGDSINAMADQLESNIGLLQQRNELLERDLRREEETNRMRQEFLANVSHDFKTPLALISAYTETLKEEQPESGQVAEYCDIILEQSARMNGMVNQLLSLSRLESGMVTLKPTFFSINDLIFSVLTGCRILMEKNGIRCEAELPQELFVEGDYQQLTNVVTNLVENAIKYAANEKLLRITLEQQEDRVRMNLFNTCDPVPEEVLAHLFDSFYKVDKSRGMEKQSYGLGLAIVRAIMDLHGGRCGVEPMEGGLNFWVELNAMEMDPETDEDEF